MGSVYIRQMIIANWSVMACLTGGCDRAQISAYRRQAADKRWGGSSLKSLADAIKLVSSKGLSSLLSLKQYDLEEAGQVFKCWPMLSTWRLFYTFCCSLVQSCTSRVEERPPRGCWSAWSRSGEVWCRSGGQAAVCSICFVELKLLLVCFWESLCLCFSLSLPFSLSRSFLLLIHPAGLPLLSNASPSVIESVFLSCRSVVRNTGTFVRVEFSRIPFSDADL